MIRLADFVSVAPRYTRAINLERDAGSAAGVSGYVVTTTANDFLGRFAKSLTPGHAPCLDADRPMAPASPLSLST